MCCFLTGFIPPGNDLAGIEGRLPRPLRRQLGVSLVPIDNPAILTARPPGDRFVRFTGHRHCDRGVPIASKIPAYDLGWWSYYGRTKGEYSLRERAERESRRAIKEARRWLSLFRYLTGEVGHFGLLLHWGHDLGEFTCDRIERLDMEAATAEALMLLDREVTYEVVR
jgi:hypothetical protein